MSQVCTTDSCRLASYSGIRGISYFQSRARSQSHRFVSPIASYPGIRGISYFQSRAGQQVTLPTNHRLYPFVINWYQLRFDCLIISQEDRFHKKWSDGCCEIMRVAWREQMERCFLQTLETRPTGSGQGSQNFWRVAHDRELSRPAIFLSRRHHSLTPW